MAAAKQQKLYRIKSPFIAGEDGKEVAYVDRRLVYPEDHPAIKRYFDSFEEISLVGHQAPVVEEATANPGEQRTTTRERAADATE